MGIVLGGDMHKLLIHHTTPAKSPRPSEAMRMKSHFVFGGANFACLTLATVSFMVDVAAAQDPEVLLRQYKCYICHSDHEPKAGPAYVDVAAKYRGNPRAVAIVAAVVRKGAHGGGPWHMPPHPEVSDPDATTIARYILSLDGQKIEKKD